MTKFEKKKKKIRLKNEIEIQNINLQKGKWQKIK
jgi:hypothetical protein